MKKNDSESFKNAVSTALAEIGVPFEEWGNKAGEKTIDDFILDLEDGTIQWDPENPEKIARISLVTARVRYECNGKILELRPKNKLVDDVIKPVLSNVTFTKLMSGNTPYFTVTNGLVQELGGKKKDYVNPNYFSLNIPETRTSDPGAIVYYPGLIVVIHEWDFICTLKTESLFSNEYTVGEVGLATTYGWIELNSHKNVTPTHVSD